MKEYLLILRDHEDRWRHFSPDDMQRTLNAFMAWNRALQEQEALLGARKLTVDRGKTVRSRDGTLLVDGPYAEAKEAVAGYYHLRAADMAQASAYAKGCPILTYGGSVEVREMHGNVVEVPELVADARSDLNDKVEAQSD